MQNPPGVFIVLEGSDGSGKTTQFNLLKARLEAVGHDIEVFDFPRYDQESSYFVRQYLNGQYGKASSISPYTASIFYALDRYEAAPAIKKALQAGKVVMSNRFVGANMAHQGSKFHNPAEQRGFFVWEDNLEFELLGIPRPTMTFFLKVPADVSQKLIIERAKQTGKPLDEHERDVEHLRRAVATYESLCQLFPNDFKAVECTADGSLLSIPVINELIWAQVQPMLPPKPAKAAKAVTVNLHEQTPAQKKQEKPTKKTTEPEQAFKGKLSLATLSHIDLASPSATSYSLSWRKGGYEFYTPANLPKKVQDKYRQIMESLVKNYKSMDDKVRKARLDPSIIDGALPLAALVSAEVKFTPQILDALAHLPLSSSETESLNAYFRKLQGAKSAGESKPEAINNIIARLARQHLPQNLAAEVEPIQLLEAWPRNEFKVLADSVYPFSSLPRGAIETEIDRWNYQQKYDALQAALKDPRTNITDQVHYRFDVVLDRQNLMLLRKHNVVDELSLQPATPRYGYEVSETVEQAGLEEEYLDCFDKSLELYSMLQAADRENLADYSVLLGHKLRAQLVCSYKSLLNLKDLPNKDLANQIVQKVTELHPVLGESLTSPAKKSSSKKGRPDSSKSKKP